MAAKQADPEKRSDAGGGGQRSSWRGTAREAGPAPARYNWQRNAADKRNPEVVRRNFRRRVTLAVFTSVLLLLLGAFVWANWIKAPPTPLWAVAITAYQAPLPPNAFAQEDVRRFSTGGVTGARLTAGRLTTGQGTLKTTTSATQWDSGDAALKDLTHWLEQTKPGGPDKSVVLLYLSAHGIVDEEGRPCLILAGSEDAKGDPSAAHLDSGRWLRLDQLVEQLDKWRPAIQKLLVLDASRMEANWNIGLLYNGFAEALEKTLEDSKSVAVLSSAGPGEVAWAAPELQGTPFGYFVAQALAGDSRADRDRDHKISLQELHRFVKERVGDWVARYRFDVQTPILTPAEQDFPVVFVDRGPSESTAPATNDTASTYFEAVKPLWENLGDLWAQHETLRSAKDERMPVWYDRCLQWHQFQQGLVRCEQLVLAGEAYRTDAENEIKQMQALGTELTRGRQGAMPLHSLPTARLAHTWPANEKSLRDVVARHLDGPPAEPPQPLPREVRTDYLLKADTAWQWLLGGDTEQARKRLSRDTIRSVLNFVGGGEGKAELVEVHILRLLVGDPMLVGSGAADEVWQEPSTRLVPVMNLRELAEQTAALKDPRVQFAIRKAVAEGDRSLRGLEDSLFAGGARLSKTEEQVEQVQSIYKAAGEQSQRLAEIYATRDRAWSLLPYLAQWLSRRAELSSAEGASPAFGIAGAAKLVKETRELEEQLTRFVAEQSPSQAQIDTKEEPLSLETIAATAGRVAAGLDRLTANVQKLADQILQQQASDERSPRDIELLLTSPLVSGNRRRQLRDRYFGEMKKSRTTWEVAAASKATKPAASSRAASNVYLEQLASWPQHPALALTRSQEPAGESADESGSGEKPGADWLRLARDGGKLRRLLLECFAAETANTSEAKHDDGAARRLALSARERQLRRAAAMCAVPPRRGNDPILRLAQFDDNELLRWHGERLLDDFWGSGDVAAPSQPYFAVAFEECRDAARKIDPADADRWQPLIALHTERKDAAKARVFVESGTDQPRMRHGSFAKNVHMNLPKVLPTGTAVLSVAEGADRPAELRAQAGTSEDFLSRLPISILANGEDTLERKLLVRQPSGAHAADKASASPSWTLTWLFRGHYQASPFAVRPQGQGLKLAYQRREPQPTTITVEGDESREASVVFVLDCSYSMLEATKSEGNRSRMDMARDALSRIVEQLAETQKYRIGLWLYGHRATFTKAGASKWNPGWPGPDASVVPGNDVAQVIPLGLLDRGMRNEVLALLDDRGKIQPWGFTPLYLSMVEALRNYQRSTVRGPRRLVVITDGVNEVPANSPKTMNPNDVVDAVRADRAANPDSPVRVQVLFCGAGGQDRALRTLVTEDIRGDYIPVTNWDELEKKLKDALGLAEYEVARVERGRDSPAQRQRLGRPVVIQDVFAPGRKYRYEVRLADRSNAVRSLVELEGEEALKLSLLRQSSAERLVHERYDRGGQQLPRSAVNAHVANPAVTGADADFNPEEFYVAAHRPEPKPGGVVAFPISVQNGDATRFSPHPAEAWIDITPVFSDKGKTADAYPFYDLAFEPERPVPVLYFEVPEWPSAARTADIRLWFKLRPSDGAASREVSIADVEAEALVMRDLHVPGATDATFNVRTEDADNGCLLIVEEEHSLESASVEWVRVQTLEPAERIERTFDYEGRLARHQFFFDKARSEVRRDKLVLTARKSVENGAATAGDPLRVTLQD